MKKVLLYSTVFLAIVGLIDSSYLTYEHYANVIPPCIINRYFPIISDCGKVLRSSYSVMFGIPLALFGVFQYLTLLIAVVSLIIWKKKILSY
ncbi:MAG: vitamin K epoxide reductase family protein, partial [Candidatus Roizmanbacteria bacterium]